MTAIRQTVRVLPGGRIEITDPALVAGTEADVVVLLSGPSGDGASPDSETADPMPGGLPLVDENGKPVFLPPYTPDPNRRPTTLVDLIGLRPSTRTAEEIDREIREGRGDDEDTL